MMLSVLVACTWPDCYFLFGARKNSLPSVKEKSGQVMWDYVTVYWISLVPKSDQVTHMSMTWLTKIQRIAQAQMLQFKMKCSPIAKPFYRYLDYAVMFLSQVLMSPDVCRSCWICMSSHQECFVIHIHWQFANK